jgi:RHS repeat-associated protein
MLITHFKHHRARILIGFLGLLILPAYADESISYQHDDNGNITQRGDTSYIYDGLERLESEIQGVNEFDYTYDNNGNRLSDGAGNYTYKANANRLLTRHGVTVTLDAAGNLTNAGGGRTYVYNQAGQLSQVKQSGTLIVTYIYNHKGQRTRKITTASAPQGARTVVYHYDQTGHLIGETTDTGTALRTYVWHDEIPVAQIEHQPTNKILYFTVDQLNTPRTATDETGKVVWRWDSEAFGSTSPVDDPDGDGAKVTINLRFPGQYYDQESGLYYNWHRYYDPYTGRYISSDPIGLKGGINTFAYVTNNPLRFIDPLGLWINGTYSSSTGVLTLHDVERNLTMSGSFESGGKPYGDPINDGSYDILERAGRDGFFRLEPLDNNYGNDKDDRTGRSHFRLHHPGRTMGCIAATNDDNWNDVEDFIKSTSTDNVTVPSMSHLPWAPGTEVLTRYGRITVTH